MRLRRHIYFAVRVTIFEPREYFEFRRITFVNVFRYIIDIFGLHAFGYVTNVADIHPSSAHENFLSTINYLIGEYCKHDDAKSFSIRVAVTFLVQSSTAARRRRISTISCFQARPVFDAFAVFRCGCPRPMRLPLSDSVAVFLQLENAVWRRQNENAVWRSDIQQTVQIGD